MRIDIWSDIACPWCYIGLTRFDRVLAGFPHADDVNVSLHSFQLDPTLPESYDGTETAYLAQTKRLPEAQVREMFSHVRSAAAPENLELGFDQVANSRKAHRVLHAAQEADESGRTAWAQDRAVPRALHRRGDHLRHGHAGTAGGGGRARRGRGPRRGELRPARSRGRR